MAVRWMKICVKRHERNGKSVTTLWSKQPQGIGHVGDTGKNVGIISNGH